MYISNEQAGEAGREAAETACGKTLGSTETHSILSKSTTPIKPPGFVVWFNFFPSKLHEGRGAGDSGCRCLPGGPAAPEVWVRLWAPLQHQAVLQESLQHLSSSASLCCHHLQWCEMPCASCNFYPVPGRQGGRRLHYYIQTQLHHLWWVQTRGQPQFVWNTRVFLSVPHFRPRKACAHFTALCPNLWWAARPLLTKLLNISCFCSPTLQLLLQDWQLNPEEPTALFNFGLFHLI